jgi:hypothetical protein
MIHPTPLSIPVKKTGARLKKFECIYYNNSHDKLDDIHQIPLPIKVVIRIQLVKRILIHLAARGTYV